MDKTYILFDLDGTVTDPGEGITNSVAYALARFGITDQPRASLYRFIGPPLRDSFMEFYGMTEEEAATAIATYREYYSEKGWLENKVYDGMAGLLADLQKAGKKLVIATSKPEYFAAKILEYFDLAKYFTVICGAPMHAPRGHGKADVIRDAFARAEIMDHGSVIMVGDRHHDVDGAHAVGIPAVGVLFGYGDRAEMEACGADFIAESMAELRDLLLDS